MANDSQVPSLSQSQQNGSARTSKCDSSLLSSPLSTAPDTSDTCSLAEAATPTAATLVATPYQSTAPARSTKERLADADERSALFDAIAEHGTVVAACEALGLSRTGTFRLAANDPDFRAQFNEARGVAWDMRIDKASALIDAATVENWQLTKFQLDSQLRIAGKLLPKTYGDTPAAAVTVNNQVVQLVCDEPTRARLIDLRAKLLSKLSASADPTPREMLEAIEAGRQAEIACGLPGQP